MVEVGRAIIDAIIRGNLVRASKDDEPVVFVWAAGADEQIGALAARAMAVKTDEVSRLLSEYLHELDAYRHTGGASVAKLARQKTLEGVEAVLEDAITALYESERRLRVASGHPITELPYDKVRSKEPPHAQP